MKIKRAVLPIACLFFTSPLFGGYAEMNTTFQNYTPPDYYIRSLERERKPTTGEPASGTTIDKANLPAGLISSRIDELNRLYEQSRPDKSPSSFFSVKDHQTGVALSATASDTRAVKERAGRSLNPWEIEWFAAVRNPAILAAKKKITAELESFSQIRALDENLNRYTAFTSGINNRTGPLKMTGSMKQQFPFPGTTALQAKMIREQIAVLTKQMEIIEKKIITDTRKAYWEIVFVERSMAITTETVQALDRLKNVATALYKSGRTSFQDVIKIKIRIEILQEALTTLLSRRQSIEVRLRELLNLPSDAVIGRVVFTEPDTPVPGLDILYSRAEKNRQEPAVIRHRINRVETLIEMAESMIQEPFTLNLSIFENQAVNTVGSGAETPSFPEKTMAGMKNNHPSKPWYGIESPWPNQTRQNLLSLKQALAAQENETRRMVRDAWFAVDKNRRELDLYQNRILPLSQSALDVSTREYESGSIPFSQAIDSYMNWLQTKLTIAEKETALGTAVSNLEQVIGTRF